MMSLKEEFENNGFVIVEDVFSAKEVDWMKIEMEKLVQDIDFSEHSKSIFTTYDEDKHTADEYFLNSSDKIRVFFEEGALDKDGNITVSKKNALNKVGHGLHWLNPVFRQITFHDKIKDLIRQLEFKQPKIVQSMYIFKQPKIGGEVSEHIDATFLYVEPISHLVGVWIAIDDATEENGCLSFIPGSHKMSSVDYRFVRTHNIEKGAPLLRFIGKKPEYDQSNFVQAPIKKGSLILIHGLVVHKSERNTSSKSRHAYTFHVMEKKQTLWNPDNWLQETETYKFPSLYE